MTKLIYLHIPKTAGMTLRQVIERQYAGQPTFSFSALHREELHEFLALSQAERDDFACILGHVHYGIHQYWSEEATYITLLRDPIERTISSYYYTLTNPKHPRYEHYRDMSLLDFARKETRGERQTRWIVGFRADGGLYGDEHPLPPDALDIAKRHLQTHFRVVGLVEEFDKTLLLMGKAFGWKNLYYARQNVNEDRPRREKVDDETLAMLRQHAEPDLSLYQFAKSLFEQQCAAYGDNLAADVESFQRRNAFFGQWWNVRAAIRESGWYRRLRGLRRESQ